LYNAALSVDNNPLPPTVPHAPKTLPDPPPKRSQLPVPIPEHPVLKGRQPVAIEAPEVSAAHQAVPMVGRGGAPKPISASSRVGSRVLWSVPAVPPDLGHQRIQSFPFVPVSQPLPPADPNFPLSADVLEGGFPIEPWLAAPPQPVVNATPSTTRFTAIRQPFDAIISNPQMGLQKEPDPVDTAAGSAGWFHPVAGAAPIPTQTHYARFFLSEVSFEYGTFDFSVIDHVLDKVVQARRRLSFRIMPYWVKMDYKYVKAIRNIRFGYYPESAWTDDAIVDLANWPAWARGYKRTPGAYTAATDLPCFTSAESPANVPKWTLPYLTRGYVNLALELIRALGLRYGDHPHVDFIDVSLFGDSGEWTPVRGETLEPNKLSVDDDNWWHRHAGVNKNGIATAAPFGVSVADAARVSVADTRLLADAMRSELPEKRRILPITAMAKALGPTPHDPSRLSTWKREENGRDVLPRAFEGFGWRQDNLGDWSERGRRGRDYRSSTMDLIQRRYLADVRDAPGREAALGVPVGPAVDLSREPVVLEITASLDQWVTLSSVKLPVRGGLWTYANTIAMTLDRALFWGVSYLFIKGGSPPPAPTTSQATMVKNSWDVFMKRMGYRLICAELSHEKRVGVNDVLTVASRWENYGVARCLGSYQGAWQVGLRLRPLFPGASEVRLKTNENVDQILPATRGQNMPGAYVSTLDHPWSSTPVALHNPLDETPDDYQPGITSLPLSVDLSSYAAFLSRGLWQLDIGIVNTQGRALVRLATRGPPEGDEWWYPMTQLELY